MEHRRTSDAGHWMIVDPCLPQQRARGRLDGVYVAGAIPDERRVAGSGIGLDPADGDGCAHAGGRRKVPMDTTGRGIERIHVAALAANEDASADNRGLGVGRHIAGKAERPFEFQTRHLRGGDSGGGAVLIARVGRVHAPAVPGWPGQRVGEAAGLGLTHGLRRRRGHERPPERFSGDVFGNGASLLRRAAARHGNHRAGFQRGENPLGRHRPERLTTWCALDAGVVACGADPPVESCPVLRGQLPGG